MIVHAQGDRKKTPTPIAVRAMTEAEVRAIPSGGHVDALLNSGRLGTVKVTSFRTWKRDPARVEIGIKYGMYEFATFSLPEAMARFVVREEQQA